MRDDIYIDPRLKKPSLQDMLKQEIKQQTHLLNRRANLDRQRIDNTNRAIKKGYIRQTTPHILEAVVRGRLGKPAGKAANYIASQYLGPGAQDIIRVAPHSYAFDPMIRASQQRQDMIKQALDNLHDAPNPFAPSYKGRNNF